MDERALRNNSARVADHFNGFVTEERDKTNVRVFLCGKALDSALTVAEQEDSNLRAHLLSRLEGEVPGCEVFLGEHTKLIRQYDIAVNRTLRNEGQMQTVNLASFEAHLANFVHLVVVFPESPGSFAELGMFSTAQPIANKLLLILDQKYEGQASFINNGPVRAAKRNRAKVHYIKYENWGEIFKLIQAEVLDIAESLSTQHIFTRDEH